MTKKHFEAIAAILDEHKQTPEYGYYADNRRVEVWEDITNDIADYFAQENPSFDKERFLKACGM